MALRILWTVAFIAALFVFFNAHQLAEIEADARAMQPNIAALIDGRLTWDTPKVVLTVVAAVTVFFAFSQRFDGWPSGGKGPAGFPEHSPRYFTTLLQFRAWAILYGLVVMAAFLTLVFAPWLADGILDLLIPLMPGNAMLSQLDRMLTAPPGPAGVPWSLGAAVMIVGIFYKSDWERGLRQLFQNNALIPRQAEQIFEELKTRIATEALGGKDSAKFLQEFREREELPTYWSFDLNPDEQQQAQGKLELLARSEFLVWRMAQGNLPQDVRARIIEHRQYLANIESRLDRIRAEANAISDQLSAVANILLDNLAPRNQEAFLERLREVTNLPGLEAPVERIPVSRVDDLIPVLESELKRIADPRKTPGKTDQPVLHIVEAHSASNRVIEKLEDQVSSLRALVPLCVKGLDTVRRRLGALSEELEDTAQSILRFAICIGLAVPHESSKVFFKTVGLKTSRLGREFDLGFGLAMASIPVLVFVLYVLTASGLLDLPLIGDWLGPGADPEAGAAAGQTTGIPSSQASLWLLFGVFYILWPMIQGCYLGSVLAYSRQKLGYEPGTGRLSSKDYAFAFFAIWSVLVLGVSALILGLGLTEDHPNLYRGVLPFSTIPAVWGTLVAVATFRMMEAARDDAVLRPWEIVVTIPLIWMLVALAWHFSADFQLRAGLDVNLPSDEMKTRILAIALFLTAVILIVIWSGSSIKAKRIWASAQSRGREWRDGINQQVTPSPGRAPSPARETRPADPALEPVPAEPPLPFERSAR